MSVAVYARMTKLTDVVGRVDYATSSNRQENLMATASTVSDPNYWQQLSADAQTAWRRAGGHAAGDRCCEAREIHGDLPNSAGEGDLQKLAEDLRDDFYRRTGHDCIVAIHYNQAKNNLHYHLIFSERLRLAEPLIQRADRNVFLDENGIRKRTKKEIMNSEGQLRPGCSIVPKGEILDVRYFGEKEEIFADRGWLKDYKTDIAAWINEQLKPDEERVVFDPAGPYLAQVHVGKGRPETQMVKMEEYNRQVKAFNKMVREGVICPQEAQAAKTSIMIAPDRLTALAAFLAGKMINEMDESHPALKDTSFRSLPEDKIDKISTLSGPERTADGPKEAMKRKLRSLYREAALERQAARTADTKMDAQIHWARARSCSSDIDRIRKELGYWDSEDYRRQRAKAEADLRKKRDWILQLKARAQKKEFWISSCDDYLRYLKNKLYSYPTFDIFCSRNEVAEKEELRSKIAEVEMKRDEAREELRKLKLKCKQERQQLKAMKKELRKAKTEERHQQKKPPVLRETFER